MSFIDLFRSGRLDNITDAVSKDDVIALIGEPDDFISTSSFKSSSIWKYGNLEFHFESKSYNAKLYMIFWDHAEPPAFCNLDSWIIRRGLKLKEAENLLKNEGIDYHSFVPEALKDQLTLETSSGAQLNFIMNQQAVYELFAFSYTFKH